MALLPLSLEYDFCADSTSKLDIVTESSPASGFDSSSDHEKFWEFHVNKWQHCEDSGFEREFDEDDRLSTCHTVFQIIACLELSFLVLHFRYRQGGGNHAELD